MKNYYIVFILCIVLVLACKKEKEEEPAPTSTSNTSTSSSDVYKYPSFPNSDMPSQIAFDKNNNVYGLTMQNGLLKLNGTSFVVIKPSSWDLINNYCYSMDVDTAGNVWIVTINIGLSETHLIKYDGTNSTIYNSSTIPELSNCTYVTASKTNGNIYLGGSGSIVSYNINTNTWATISGSPSANMMPSNTDANGNAWFYDYNLNGIYKYDGSTWTTISNCPIKNKTGVHVNANINVAGTDSLAVYNGSTWNLYKLSQMGMPLCNQGVGLTSDNAGNIYIAQTNNTTYFSYLFLFNGNTFTSVSAPSSITYPQPSGCYIYEMCIGKNKLGNVYVGGLSEMIKVN